LDAAWKKAEPAEGRSLVLRALLGQLGTRVVTRIMPGGSRIMAAIVAISDARTSRSTLPIEEYLRKSGFG
jgi:hypothetical protein